jgi:hypothetical protein
MPRLDRGAVRVWLDTVEGVPDSITVNGMPVGATIHQLSSVYGIKEGMAAEGLERRVLSTSPFTLSYWEDPHDGAELCRALNETLAAVRIAFGSADRPRWRRQPACDQAIGSALLTWQAPGGGCPPSA